LWAEYLRCNGFAPNKLETEADPMRNWDDEIQRLRGRNFLEDELRDDASTTDGDLLDGDSDGDEEGESLETVETPLTEPDSDDDEEDSAGDDGFPLSGRDDTTKVNISADMPQPDQEKKGLPPESNTTEDIQPLLEALKLVDEPDEIDAQKVEEEVAQPTASDTDPHTTLIPELPVHRPENENEHPKTAPSAHKFVPYPKNKVSSPFSPGECRMARTGYWLARGRVKWT
jgi:hypothetical protein